MKIPRVKWLTQNGCFLFVYLIAVAALTGCIATTESRIRHYFGLTRNQPLQDTVIRAALLKQFPPGTPSTLVESALAARGMGRDAKSTIWQPQTNILCCQPYDYPQHIVAAFPMRRITICFDLDEQQEVKQIDVSSMNYGL